MFTSEAETCCGSVWEGLLTHIKAPVKMGLRGECKSQPLWSYHSSRDGENKCNQLRELHRLVEGLKCHGGMNINQNKGFGECGWGISGFNFK